MLNVNIIQKYKKMYKHNFHLNIIKSQESLLLNPIAKMRVNGSACIKIPDKDAFYFFYFILSAIKNAPQINPNIHHMSIGSSLFNWHLHFTQAITLFPCQTCTSNLKALAILGPEPASQPIDLSLRQCISRAEGWCGQWLLHVISLWTAHRNEPYC